MYYYHFHIGRLKKITFPRQNVTIVNGDFFLYIVKV